MPAQELHSAGAHVGVDLRCHDYGYLVLPGGVQEHLGLPYEVVPGPRVVVVQAVEHREGVYHHERDRSRRGELLDLVYAVGLLLEAVDLEDQEVLYAVLLAGEHLGEPVRGQPFGVDVGHLLAFACDVAGYLEADVGLAGPCLSVE